MQQSHEAKLSKQLKGLVETESLEISVKEISDQIGEKGFGLVLLLFSLPSALPVPAPGYSVPFGLVLFLIALQLIGGKRRLVFPQRVQRITLSKEFASKLIRRVAPVFAKLETLIRPRMSGVFSSSGKVLMGVLVLLMAILMMIPIPLTNTFPAMVIFLIGVGMTEEDGLFGLGAILLGFVAVLLYGSLVYAIIVHGPEVVVTIKDTIKSWF